ncbi:ABC transporter ATP-binding protein [Deinococcus roseus]|uniref:ABC transporter ATP-binding protein n=1 Tax=Deinococcus roseus TaxID=392414 RepID=A0ABQ2D0Y0_9DEIO|nr:ABC transporter ATP-binding protein [Deinococcus roseus]GGJ40141.1 ABC transporter ATP-binding protein [Deinococcus roseus]
MIVRLQDVEYAYTTESAVGPISLTINKGDFISIVGPSGSGKSTLMNLLSKNYRPTAGILEFAPGTRIIMVQQDPGLFPWRTALHNVTFGLEMQGASKFDREERARAAMDLVGLKGFENRRIHELSGGQKQRVALARALIMKPDLLLLDEPFSALDPHTRNSLGEELRTIWQETGQTILLVTHDHIEAELLAQKVVVLEDGKIKTVVDLEVESPRSARKK